MAGHSKKLGPGAGDASTRQGSSSWSRRNFAPVIFLSIDPTGHNDPGSAKAADDLLRQLIDFSHKRHLAKAAETHFKFRNDDRKLLDDPRLLPNTLWQFRFGFLNDISPIINGYIRNLEPVYADRRTVTVTLYDSTATLSTKSSGKNWGKVSTSTIAQAIAKKHGLKFAGEDSKDAQKKAWIQPNNTNDIQYLRDLAVLIDFEVFVDGNPATLYYRKKPYDQAPRGELVYYDDPSEFSYVKSFAPKVKSLGPIATSVSGTDSDKGKNVKTETTGQGPSALDVQFTLGDQGIKGVDVIRKKDVSVHAPSGHKPEQLVQAARQQILDKCNEAHSTHMLTPSISAGAIYTWRGMEKSVNGKWYCLEEHHTISGTGYGTTAQWKRNAAGEGGEKAKNVNNTGVAASPSVPVVQIDAATRNAVVITSSGKR